MGFYEGVSKCFGGFLSKILYPTKVKKLYESLPEGPIVLMSNHISGVDVVLLVACNKKIKIRFMAKKELFKIPLVGSFIKAMGAFPVNRAGADVAAIRKGIELLKEGATVGVFPQGTRCTGLEPSETREKLHGGAAMMAIRAKAAILPAAIITKKFKILPFRRVRLYYGKPITYEEYEEMSKEKEGRDLVTGMVFDRICGMIEEDEKANGKMKAKETK